MDSSPLDSQWALLRDEFQYAYRESSSKSARCCIQIRLGIPYSSDSEKKWRPDLESRIGPCGRLFAWRNLFRPNGNTFLICFFGDANGGEGQTLLATIDAATNLLNADTRQAMLRANNWIMALYYIAWNVPKAVSYTVDCFSFRPDGFPLSETPFDCREAFERWDQGHTINSPFGRYFLVLSHDIRFCSIAAIDFLQHVRGKELQDAQTEPKQLENIEATSANLRSPNPSPDVPPSDSEPFLGERDRLVLIVLRDAKAFDSDHRMRTADIVLKAAGKAADPNPYKEVMAKLKRCGYIGTKEGRGGGCWLTDAGRRRAEKL